MDELLLAELLRIRAGLTALQIQMTELRVDVEKLADPATAAQGDRFQTLSRTASVLQQECLRMTLEQGPDITPGNVARFLQGWHRKG